MTFSRFAFASMALIVFAASSARAEALPLEVQLRAEDERLLCAVHQGGRVEWSKVTTPGFLYVEEGGIMNRAQLLSQMNPDGHHPLHINEYHVVRTGDLAIVVHHDDVPDPMTGALTRSQYVMTETWQLIKGRWMLHMVHVDAVHAAPPIMALADSEFDRLTGIYWMGSKSLVVRRDGSHLVAFSEGQTAIKLEPETSEVFFDPNELRQRWIFELDAQGHVIGLRCRDENHDRSIWERKDRTE